MKGALQEGNPRASERAIRLHQRHADPAIDKVVINMAWRSGADSKKRNRDGCAGGDFGPKTVPTKSRQIHRPVQACAKACRSLQGHASPHRMYIHDRLVTIALPAGRIFRGLNGELSMAPAISPMGIKEHIVFPR